jgi:hypothetical protein
MVTIFSNALSVDTRCWFTVSSGEKTCEHGLATSRVPAIKIIQVGPICLQSDGYGVSGPQGCIVVDFMQKATVVNAVT